MSDRPSHLIFVRKPGEHEVQVVSAHYGETDARKMLDMLAKLVSPDSAVYLLPVPETDGIMSTIIHPVNEPQEPVQPVEAAAVPVLLPAPVSAPAAPVKPQEPFRRLTREQFEAETIELEEAGQGQWRDADAGLSEGGAFG